MAPYTSPSLTVAGSLRALTQQGIGDGGTLEVGSLPFPQEPPVTTT